MIQYWKVKDQIDTIERLEAKLKYGVKDRDQICSLPFILLGSLYYFIEMYVKIRIEMLGVLLNELIK